MCVVSCPAGYVPAESILGQGGQGFWIREDGWGATQHTACGVYELGQLVGLAEVWATGALDHFY